MPQQPTKPPHPGRTPHAGTPRPHASHQGTPRPDTPVPQASGPNGSHPPRSAPGPRYHRVALALLLALAGGLTAFALAQGTDSAGDPGHDASDHAMDGGTMDGNDMGEHDMGGQSMADMPAGAPGGGGVMLAGAGVRLEPLIEVGADGLRAVVRLAFDAPPPADLAATLTPPHGGPARLTLAAGDEPNSVFFDWDERNGLAAGIWQLDLDGGGDSTRVPIEVAHGQGQDGVRGVLVMAPAPSMATQGGATAFVYVYRDGDNVHADPTLQRHMAGMQHSTDTEVVELQHVHAAMPGVAGGDAMPNVAAVSFPMLGTWSVDVTLQTSPPQVLHFDAEVLGP